MSKNVKIYIDCEKTKKTFYMFFHFFLFTPLNIYNGTAFVRRIICETATVTYKSIERCILQ